MALTLDGTTGITTSGSSSSGGSGVSTNTALGGDALKVNEAGGTNNTAIGYQALDANTTGDNNVGVGDSALGANTTTSANTAIGSQALANNTAADNTAIGFQAGLDNTSGTGNFFGGSLAGNKNTTGSGNTGIGGSWSGTALPAFYFNTTGSSNTAIGCGALPNNTTASNNTAVGYQAGYSNTTGNLNAYFGNVAGYATTTGTRVTAIGSNALQDNTTGGYNTAVGQGALASNTTGSYNTAIGQSSLVGMSGSGLHTAVGYLAGDTLTNGTGCTLIGSYAQPSSASGDYQIFVCTTGGSNVLGKGNSTGFINPNGGGVFQGNNSSSWSTTSDQRLKKNIVDNTEGLNKINGVRVRNFEYRLPEEITDLPEHSAIQKTGVQLGVIAQELQQVCPDCVTEQSTGVLSVDTDEIFWHMVNAIKELSAQVTALQAEVNALKGQ